ncbi:MAG: GTP 3',8-cyclase MoaA [Clostridiales Family XIII bacterium]|nr:GTP 3',8-cyclase MoaA [Clostridiales Family XIII bacterium]
MIDSFGRTIDYLRISVTDRCNLRCVYCMPDGFEDIGHDRVLSFEQIERVVRAAVVLGFRKFRLTGGEPLVRRGVVRLVEMLAAIPGVDELNMTSNGTLLEGMAAQLKKAGLTRVNISLDTLRADRFREITRGGDIEAAKRGIAAAEAAGLSPVRLNVVAMRGFNDDEILDFAAMTKEKPYDIRFIELMPIGKTGRSGFMPAHEIRAVLKGCEPLDDRRGVAEYIAYPGAPGRIGLISPISAHFCGGCNKIRLTSDGRIKTCLHSNSEEDMLPALRDRSDEALRRALGEIILRKEERHFIADGMAPIERGMYRIGG